MNFHHIFCKYIKNTITINTMNYLSYVFKVRIMNVQHNRKHSFYEKLQSYFEINYNRKLVIFSFIELKHVIKLINLDVYSHLLFR